MAKVAEFEANEGLKVSIDAARRVVTIAFSTEPKVELKFGPSLAKRFAVELMRAVEHAQKLGKD